MADDMNRIVYEQQEFFDEAEKHIAEADNNVAAGTSEVALVRSPSIISFSFSSLDLY